MGIWTLGALCKDNTKYWLPSIHGNGVFFCDTDKSDEFSYIGAFEDYQEDNSWKIQKVISHNEKIYFFSKYAYEMWVLDEKTNKIKHYIYCDEEVNMISSIVNISNMVWIFPQNLKYPIKHMDLDSYDNDSLKFDIPSDISDSAITKVVKNGNKIFFATRKESNIYLVEMVCEKNEIKFSTIPELVFINCLGVVGKNVYLLGVDKEQRTILLKYDINKSEVVEKIHLSKVKLKLGLLMDYSLMVIFKNRIFFIPCMKQNIICYDIDTGTEEVLDYPEDFICSDIVEVKFEDIQVDGNLITLFPHSSDRILKLDMQTLNMSVIMTKYSDRENIKFLSNVFKRKYVIQESEPICLQGLLQNVQCYKEDVNVNKDNFGMRIYEFCK